ncbi:MAG: Fe-S cluster assembly ATPase SufC [Candidatus Ancillula sp.]|jgi:Fe-S cluster assembly ATP-binding protein|nr:Fe-S cluster assembly ATPase SufC [Candidatus Ancillula sp.]
MLEVKDLHVAIGDKEILKGVNLEIEPNKTYAIMGPNGSGKSTLSYTIAGHPRYTVTKGKIVLDGEDITNLPPDERAKLGIFLAQQLPTEVEGISLSNFLRAAVGAVSGETPAVRQWVKDLQKAMSDLKMNSDFAGRSLNVGFSGGEKKKAEILQLKMLKPKYAILDETDSGLDVDALKIVSDGVKQAKTESGFGTLLITHHTNLLKYLIPDYVYVFAKGHIVEEGTSALAEELEQTGYQNYIK